MDTVTQLLLRARTQGLCLEVNGDQLTVRGPRRCAGVAEEIRQRKTEVLTALRVEGKASAPDRTPLNPGNSGGCVGGERSEAARVWRETVEEVASSWREVASAFRSRGEAPPWLPEEIDLPLQASVGEAIRTGDVEVTHRRAGAWREAWERLLHPSPDTTPENPEKSGGCVGLRLSRELRERLEARAEALDGEALFDLVEDKELAVAERDLYRGEILSRADAAIASSDGKATHWNQSVCDMFDEARDRLGWRDVEERSITTWLRKHAPEVAALWPQAPPTASWFDWRLQVGSEHVAVLDEALASPLRPSAVNPPPSVSPK